MEKNKLILITGGSSSGKTYIAEKIANILGDKATVIAEDMFYKNGNKDTNFDHPSAIDFNEETNAIHSLVNNKVASVPVYDFTISKRTGTKNYQPKKYIIVEGIFAFKNPDVVNMADFKIFIDTPADTRLARRIKRDINERNREPNSIIDRWLKDVQPSYKEHISPEKSNADIIIPWHKINERSIKSIVVSITSLFLTIEDITK